MPLCRRHCFAVFKSEEVDQFCRLLPVGRRLASVAGISVDQVRMQSRKIEWDRCIPVDPAPVTALIDPQRTPNFGAIDCQGAASWRVQFLGLLMRFSIARYAMSTGAFVSGVLMTVSQCSPNRCASTFRRSTAKATIFS